MSLKYLNPNVVNNENDCRVHNAEIDGVLDINAMDVSGNWYEHLVDHTYQQLVSGVTAVGTSGEYFVIDTSTITINPKGAGMVDTSFVVNNPLIESDDHIESDIYFYSGTYSTNGIPFMLIDDINAGSFVTRIYNNSSATAVNGTMKLYYRLIHPPL